MLKKLKALGGGLYKWKIKLWVDGRQIHEHHVLTTEAANRLYADLLNAKARAKSGLPYFQPVKRRTLAEAAAEYEAGLLAPREDGKRFSYQAFKRAFRAAGRDLNEPGQTPHAIRAGRAVWDLEAGIPIWAVRDKLGHTSVTTTERYLRAARASALFGKASIRARICPKTRIRLTTNSRDSLLRNTKENTSKARVHKWLKDKLRA